jgi:hypothetical protein
LRNCRETAHLRPLDAQSPFDHVPGAEHDPLDVTYVFRAMFLLERYLAAQAFIRALEEQRCLSYRRGGGFNQQCNQVFENLLNLLQAARGSRIPLRPIRSSGIRLLCLFRNQCSLCLLAHQDAGKESNQMQDPSCHCKEAAMSLRLIAIASTLYAPCWMSWETQSILAALFVAPVCRLFKTPLR